MPDTTESYRIGVIGTGTIGSQHCRVLSTMRQARLVAVADLNEETARKAIGTSGAVIYGDYQQMLAQERLDGVVVATPDPMHRAPVEAAAAAGVGVLVEKPIATSAEDADAMIAACAKARVPLLVGFVLRYEANYVKIHEAVEGGMIGRPVAMFARRQNLVSGGRRLAPVTDPLTFLGIHDIDQILWNQPEKVVRVSATATHGVLSQETGKPECVFTTLSFADGSVAVVESGWSLPQKWVNITQPPGWAGSGSMRFDLNGSEGYLSLDFRAPLLVGMDNTDGWKYPETRHWPHLHGKPTGALRLQMEHFVDCLAGDAKPIADGESAKRAVLVVQAAHRALESGQPQSVSI